MNAGKVISILLVGAAAGAILGVFMAPGKGSETRRKISRKGSEIVDDLKSNLKIFIGDDASDPEYDGSERFDVFKESASHSFH